MSVEAGASLTLEGVAMHGLSLSGIRTAVALPDLSLSFDVAQGYPFLLTLKKFFVTHGHLDHAAGIPYIISQKAMTRQPRPVFYMPPSLVEPMTRIMRTWEEIEEHRYEFDFVATRPDDRIELNPQWVMKAFPAVHRIEALGYTLFERRKRLAPAFRSLPRDEIARQARSGIEVNETEELPVLSFTGDTRIEFLDQRPWIRDSKLLLMECTYLDERKSVAHARDWGHLHLDELIARLDDIRSAKIVLIHLSSRYTTAEARSILDRRIPREHRDRIEIFPGR